MTISTFPIFDKLGGLDAALSAIRHKAIRESWPSRHTLKDWARRRRLPPRVVLLFHELCDERGVPHTPDDFRADAKKLSELEDKRRRSRQARARTRTRA